MIGLLRLYFTREQKKNEFNFFYEQKSCWAESKIISYSGILMILRVR